jgi:RNA-directed DNA polymerase
MRLSKRVTPPQVAQFRQMKEPGDVALFLGTTERRLNHFLYKQRPQYHVFTIAKASGGVREIRAPEEPIRAWQREILKAMSAIFVPMKAVHGFAYERSVVSNAKFHVGRRLILNCDLQDFFPSIHFGRVRGVFSSKPFNFSTSVSAILAHICCASGTLPQGGPMSPLLSNLVCRGLDHQLVALARATGCRYSRYADDITLSTNGEMFPPAIVKNAFAKPLELGESLVQLIEAHKFTINAKKTRLRHPRQRQDVTGLTVNEKVNVQRDYVRSLRALIHDWQLRGEALANERFLRSRPGAERQHDDAIRDHLRGRLAFLKMVRGREDIVYLRYATRFAELAEERPPAVTGEGALSPPLLLGAMWLVVATDHSGDVLDNGSAFATHEHGIVTSAHVFQRPAGLDPHELVTWAAIPAWKPTRRYPIKTITESQHFDLARFDVPCATPAVLGLGTVAPVIGAPVTLAGFPNWNVGHQIRLEKSHLTTARVLSLVEHLMISGSILPGNSGGPLLDEYGRVVGVARYDQNSPVAPNSAVAAKHLVELSGSTATTRAL